MSEESTEPISLPEAAAEMRPLSRRGFLWMALAVAGTYGGFKYLASRSESSGIPWPFRQVLATNERLSEDYFSPNSKAKEFDRSQARPLKDNGDLGLSDDFDPAEWKLSVVGAKTDGLMVDLAEIKKLGAHDMTTELRCIEGWSVVMNWTGCRLKDFVAKYPPAGYDHANVEDPTTLPPYVGMETPDGGYFVGLDMQSALHPQTLLCWAMNGEPLTLEHGAPLRLVIPTKYGIKNMKRIGTLTYTDVRPHDYWAEEGYDYFAGL